MGCAPSRVQPQDAAALTKPDDAPEPAPAPMIITTTVESSPSPDPSSASPAPVLSSNVEAYTPLSQSTSNAVIRPLYIHQPSTSHFPSNTSALTPRSQLSPSSSHPPSPALHAPPASDSVPRQSILKQPGQKKERKDFDAIRAMKQFNSPHSAHNLSNKQLRRVDDEEEKEQQPGHSRGNSLREEKVEEVKDGGGGGGGQSASPTHSTGGIVQVQGVGSRQNSFKQGGSKKGKRRTSHQGMMSKLALQFPAIRESFQAVYSSFLQFCQQSTSSSPSAPSVSSLGCITLEQFPDLLNHLTAGTQTFTPDLITGLFTLSQVTHSPTLTFREVLIAIAMGYYLAAPPACHDPAWEKVGRGFRMVEKAFQEIDDDGSGMLSVNEMKQALFAASPVKGKQDEEKDTLDMRFRELDLNGDGDVEFKEFLYGVVSWVGMTSEEEMDDIAIEADG